MLTGFNFYLIINMNYHIYSFCLLGFEKYRGYLFNDFDINF